MNSMKTVIPAAGLGTRFLPFTKTIPKELLPLLNKPAIHHIIQEAILSHLNSFLIITNKNKGCLADYLEYTHPLEHDNIPSYATNKPLEALNSLIKESNFSYIRQSQPLGLGHAIWLARDYIHKEYFSIMLPDELFFSSSPALSQLIKVAQQERASIVGVQEVPHNMVSNYGIIKVKKQISPTLYQVGHIVEKPASKDAPSNLALVGRYVLSHKIFNCLENSTYNAQGELQLTDAISSMIHANEKVFAYKIQATRYDIGTPLGWLRAVVAQGLDNPAYQESLEEIFNGYLIKKNIIAQASAIAEHTIIHKSL